MGLYENYALCVSRENDPHGLLLSADGFDFYADMRVRPDGLISVVSSTTAGEGPNDIRYYLVDLDAFTVNGKHAAWMDLTQPAAPIRASSSGTGIWYSR